MRENMVTQRNEVTMHMLVPCSSAARWTCAQRSPSSAVFRGSFNDAPITIEFIVSNDKLIYE
jgi:hypothetical protein